jgi:hypothetical protein
LVAKRINNDEREINSNTYLVDPLKFYSNAGDAANPLACRSRDARSRRQLYRTATMPEGDKVNCGAPPRILAKLRGRNRRYGLGFLPIIAARRGGAT